MGVPGAQRDDLAAAVFAQACYSGSSLRRFAGKCKEWVAKRLYKAQQRPLGPPESQQNTKYPLVARIAVCEPADGQFLVPSSLSVH